MRVKKDRSGQILELIIDSGKTEVTRLAEALGVSKVTIRKDLDELEERGIIRREHGYAMLGNQDDLAGRIAYHYEEKKMIAARAAELVNDGDTILVENGSCCALLADALAASKRNITLITNSVFIADYIRKKCSFDIVLLGGNYQRDSQVMVGPMVRQTAENFCVDLFFIGTDGYSARSGFTNRDQMRAQAVRDMALAAEQVIVLTESQKFSGHSAVPLNLKNKIHTVITDPLIDPSIVKELASAGIKVIQAK